MIFFTLKAWLKIEVMKGLDTDLWRMPSKVEGFEKNVVLKFPGDVPEAEPVLETVIDNEYQKPYGCYDKNY